MYFKSEYVFKICVLYLYYNVYKYIMFLCLCHLFGRCLLKYSQLNFKPFFLFQLIKDNGKSSVIFHCRISNTMVKVLLY